MAVDDVRFKAYYSLGVLQDDSYEPQGYVVDVMKPSWSDADQSHDCVKQAKFLQSQVRGRKGIDVEDSKSALPVLRKLETNAVLSTRSLDAHMSHLWVHCDKFWIVVPLILGKELCSCCKPHSLMTLMLMSPNQFCGCYGESYDKEKHQKSDRTTKLNLNSVGSVGKELSLRLNHSTSVAASLEVSESPGSVQVARGQTAVLPCTFSTSAALINLNVIWMVIPLSNANQPEQVILYQGGQMFDGAPRFHGRVGFTGTMPATNVSIFINNTQLSDTGTYQCLVNNLPDRGGRNIGVTGLTVLVPPSAPHCQIQGPQDIGSDVILLCSSEEGTPRPTYLWEKLDSSLQLPPTATQEEKIEREKELSEDTLSVEEKANTHLLLGMCVDTYARYLLFSKQPS
eukprot:bmy_17390T0